MSGTELRHPPTQCPAAAPRVPAVPPDPLAPPLSRHHPPPPPLLRSRPPPGCSGTHTTCIMLRVSDTLLRLSCYACPVMPSSCPVLTCAYAATRVRYCSTTMLLRVPGTALRLSGTDRMLLPGIPMDPNTGGVLGDGGFWPVERARAPAGYAPTLPCYALLLH
eukprot:3940232-Rhodomonas_salina.3